MKDFKVRLKEITDPYRISRPAGMDPLYDYGVCGVIENFLEELMEAKPICTSYAYMDCDTDGISVRGCMTITIMEHYLVPEVFTFLYERDLNTCYE